MLPLGGAGLPLRPGRVRTLAQSPMMHLAAGSARAGRVCHGHPRSLAYSSQVFMPPVPITQVFEQMAAELENRLEVGAGGVLVKARLVGSSQLGTCGGRAPRAGAGVGIWQVQLACMLSDHGSMWGAEGGGRGGEGEGGAWEGTAC